MENEGTICVIASTSEYLLSLSVLSFATLRPVLGEHNFTRSGKSIFSPLLFLRGHGNSVPLAPKLEEGPDKRYCYTLDEISLTQSDRTTIHLAYQ